jgi:hypothetical protein
LTRFEVVAFSESLWENEDQVSRARSRIEKDLLLRDFTYLPDRTMCFRTEDKTKAENARDFVATYFGLDPEDVIIREVRECHSCGEELDPGDAFCRHCGTKVA